MTLLEDILGEMHVPEGLFALVPRQTEYVIEESDPSRRFHVSLAVQTIDFFLEDLAGRIWHVDDLVQLLLELSLLALFVVLKNSLVGVLEQASL